MAFDRGSEFIGKDFQEMMKEVYVVKAKAITVRNPWANAIVERIYQVIGNIIRAFELEDNYLDEDQPWQGILSAMAFAVWSLLATLQQTPGKWWEFGHEMIFNAKHMVIGNIY